MCALICLHCSRALKMFQTRGTLAPQNVNKSMKKRLQNRNAFVIDLLFDFSHFWPHFGPHFDSIGLPFAHFGVHLGGILASLGALGSLLAAKGGPRAPKSCFWLHLGSDLNGFEGLFGSTIC